MSAAEIREEAASLRAEAEASLALVAFGREHVAKLAALLDAYAELIDDRRPAEFIQLGPDVRVRRDQVASCEWEHRHYMNGSRSFLRVYLVDGRTYKFEHFFSGIGGVDCAALEQEILA